MVGSVFCCPVSTDVPMLNFAYRINLNALFNFYSELLGEFEPWFAGTIFSVSKKTTKKDGLGAVLRRSPVYPMISWGMASTTEHHKQHRDLVPINDGTLTADQAKGETIFTDYSLYSFIRCAARTVASALSMRSRTIFSGRFMRAAIAPRARPSR